jgi:hypothetical protein
MEEKIPTGLGSCIACNKKFFYVTVISRRPWDNVLLLIEVTYNTKWDVEV